MATAETHTNGYSRVHTPATPAHLYAVCLLYTFDNNSKQIQKGSDYSGSLDPIQCVTVAVYSPWDSVSQVPTPNEQDQLRRKGMRSSGGESTPASLCSR